MTGYTTRLVAVFKLNCSKWVWDTLEKIELKLTV